MHGFMCPHLDPSDARWQWVQRDAIAGVGGPAVATHNLLGRERLLAGPQYPPGGIVEGDIKVCDGGIGGCQPFENITPQGQFSVLSLQPNLFDHDYGRIHALEANMGQVGRRPERCGAAGNQECGQHRKT
jgi:hypothetical protein